MFCRTICNIWQQGSKNIALCLTGGVSDIRPIIILRVKMLDFSFIWFSANHLKKPCQKQDVSLHDNINDKGTPLNFLQKVQISFSLMLILFRFNGSMVYLFHTI